MSTHIRYSAAERASFALVPETCPAVEGAMDAAFDVGNFTLDEIAAVLTKYGIEPDKRLQHALAELVGVRLFAKKRAMAQVVLHEGTFPLRAALVAQVQQTHGLPVERNRFAEWVEHYRSGRA